MLFFIIYFVFGYRKKVVVTNLKKSFPEKSNKEIEVITKKFYSYLCDLIVETLKIPTLTKEDLEKRCFVHSMDMVNELYDNGKGFVLVLGHQGNYEWGNLSLAAKGKYNFHGIVHPFKNKKLNDFFIQTRGRLGTNIIQMKEAYLKLDEIKTEKAILGFIADQSPRPTNAYWTTFLNQDTGFFWGVERVSKEYDLPVVFVHIDRKRRGYYEIYPELIVKNPSEYKEGEITEIHVRKLEEYIKKKPETWLWSHRRWKHVRPILNT